MKQKMVVGVDIGGTKINTALVLDGKIIKFFTTETAATQPKDTSINNLFYAISQVMADQVEAIGIGVPGIIDSENGIINEVANIPAWKNIHLKEIIQTKFSRKVFLNNDANCFVLGNKIFGDGKNYRDIVGITLGTGLGSGIIVNNNLYSGNKNGAGEFGQLPYKDSIFESYCSAKFFKLIKHIDGEKIFDYAEKGDPESLMIWKEFGNHVGEMVRLVIYTLAPELIVFGGSVSKANKFFHPEVEQQLANFELRKVADAVKIIYDTKTDSAVLGAAALCFTG